MDAIASAGRDVSAVECENVADHGRIVDPGITGVKTRNDCSRSASTVVQARAGRNWAERRHCHRAGDADDGSFIVGQNSRTSGIDCHARSVSHRDVPNPIIDGGDAVLGEADGGDARSGRGNRPGIRDRDVARPVIKGVDTNSGMGCDRGAAADTDIARYSCQRRVWYTGRRARATEIGSKDSSRFVSADETRVDCARCRDRY